MLDIYNQLEGNPGECRMGILIMNGVQNGSGCEKIRNIKNEITDGLIEKFKSINRKELKNSHPLDVYTAYYKKFGYTYHLLLQLESVLRGKRLPDSSIAVEAMFMAEMKNMLLTAAHDAEKVVFPVCLRKAAGERYTAINGKSVDTISEDLMMQDSLGVISSILKGPDQRTCINNTTKNILYTVYAPGGVEEELIEEHLDDIESYVRAGSPLSLTVMKKIISGYENSPKQMGNYRLYPPGFGNRCRNEQIPADG